MTSKMNVVTFATKVLNVKLHPPQAMTLRMLYALPPAPGDLDLFQALTGREEWPTKDTLGDRLRRAFGASCYDRRAPHDGTSTAARRGRSNRTPLDT